MTCLKKFIISKLLFGYLTFSSPEKEEIAGLVNLTEANNSGVNGELLIEHHGPDHFMLHGKIWNLSEGEHAIHVHEYGLIGNDCADAGGHFNPSNVYIFSIYCKY